MAKLTTLVSFDIADGENPQGGLSADAAGDLFGTTNAGGANGDGTVFEVAKSGNGYASTPTTLVSFDATDGYDPSRAETSCCRRTMPCSSMAYWSPCDT